MLMMERRDNPLLPGKQYGDDDELQDRIPESVRQSSSDSTNIGRNELRFDRSIALGQSLVSQGFLDHAASILSSSRPSSSALLRHQQPEQSSPPSSLRVNNLYFGRVQPSRQVPTSFARQIPATNTPPMQIPSENVSSALPGVDKLENSMKIMFKNMSGRQTMEKTRANENDIDMNLPFPVKLHYILSHPKYQDCVAWLPHGRAWRILKPKDFEKEVIPKFFRSAKYASFMRQVNGWAFTRITEGPDLNAYYHDMFLRGLPNLSFKMKRPPKVKSAAAAARNAAGASSGIPDFYRIGRIAPLPPAQPFRPVASETASGEDESGVTDGYEIELLGGYSSNPPLEDMPLIVNWNTSIASDSNNFANMPFLNPFENSSEDSSPPRVAGQQTGAGLSQDAAVNERPTEQVAEPAHSVPQHRTGSALSENDSQNLTKADLTYLAHQNQILLLHAEQELREGSKS